MGTGGMGTRSMGTGGMGSVDGLQCGIKPPQRGDPVLHQITRHLRRHVFRHGGYDRGPGPGGITRCLDGPDRGMPAFNTGDMPGREIQHQRIDINASRQRTGERRGQPLLITPVKRVVIERVRHRHQRVDRLGNRSNRRIIEIRHGNAVTLGSIGHQ